MALKRILMKLRQVMLCCNKPSLDIGSPTNVRRVDISDALPGLTDAERKNIREKASSDAIYLLGLQSHPYTSPPSPTGSHSPTTPSPSLSSLSREPSEPLLNAASKDLPSALPTPPRQMHSQSSPPTVRMKSMWEDPNRNPRPSMSNSSRSSSTTANDNSDRVLGRVDTLNTPAAKDPNKSFMTLNLEFDWEDGTESPRELRLSEGFEVADTVGGAAHEAQGETTPSRKTKVVDRSVLAARLAECSDSDTEVEGFVVAAGNSPLGKI